MMRFHLGFDALQDLYCFLVGRFVNPHDLEASCQGAIRLNMLAEFCCGAGTNAVDFAPAQGGFEDIGSIQRPFTSPGPHHRMQFIDEQHQVGIIFSLFDHFLDFGLKFPPKLRAGHQGAHGDFHHMQSAQRFHCVFTGSIQRQTFHHGSLTHTGFS